MSARIRFFRDFKQAHETQEFLITHNIKSYLCKRTPETTIKGEDPYGFDVFVLREDDVKDAHQILDFEYGSEWGERTSEG